MGCDIHAYKEVKIKGQWHSFGEAEINRRYGVFALMAGVRGPVENQLFTVKGLPDDVSVVVQALSDRWGVDGHTHSYLTSVELARLKRKLEEWNKDNPLESAQGKWWIEEFGRVGYTCILDFIDDAIDGDSEKWIEDVRLVFWFDN